MHDHLKVCPRRNDKKQGVLKTSKEGGVKTLSNSGRAFSQEVSREKLVRMIAMHEIPFRFVELEGVRDFLDSLQPMFKMPSRTTARNDLMKLYEQEKLKILKIFDKNQSRVAITTDMWTSNQKKGFMAITAHFIDDSWSLQSRIIRFVHVMTPHTAENLRDVLLSSLMEWNLDSKLSTLTVDNCTTNDALIEGMLSKIPKKHLLLGGLLFHMRCCAHILNLIVKEGLKYCSSSIEKIHDSVVYWTAGPKRVEKFEEVLGQLKIPCTKKLAMDVSTRWNSTFLMLESVLPYRDAFERLHRLDSQYVCLPSDSDWEIASELYEKLELFYSVTEIFSGTKYPTSNLFFPNICDIKIALNEWETCGSKHFEVMASKMRGKFDKYWDEIHGILGVAIILDPRFKVSLLEYYYPLLYDDEVAKFKIQRVKDICGDLVHEYSTKINQLNSVSYHSPSLSMPKPPSNKRDRLAKFDQFMASRGVQKEKNALIELESYLKEDVMPRNDDFDILNWWSQAHQYPTLKLIARDILAIPISTVASECAFSTSGRVISEHRSRLCPETIEALMCLQNWIWSEREDCRTSAKFLAQYCDLLEDENDD